MEAYLIPIKTAFLIFPIIAAFLTLPYMIQQYHKYGSISFLRTVILYSFILYLLCMYFLVILPLPSIEEVSQMTTPTMQLKPFQFVRDFLRETKFQLGDSSTYLQAVKQNCFLQVVFNIVLFMPFGVYLNYYFQYSFRKVLGFGFCLSLFFELTQLSGLYGIYPRAYRLFDVDDIFLNISGAVIGYPFGALAKKLLPKREEIDRMAYERGRVVSFGRRWIALLIDGGIFLGIAFVENAIFAVIVAVIQLYLLEGVTFGKWLLKIRIVNGKEKKLSLLQCLLREGIPILGLRFFPIIFMIVIGFDLISGNKNKLFYERISQTYCISIRNIEEFPKQEGTKDKVINKSKYIENFDQV